MLISRRLASQPAVSFLGLPGILYLLVLIGALWLILGVTAYKRNLMAVGGELRAAYTSGVDVVGVRILAYVIAGLVSAVAGMVLRATRASAESSSRAMAAGIDPHLLAMLTRNSHNTSRQSHSK